MFHSLPSSSSTPPPGLLGNREICHHEHDALRRDSRFVDRLKWSLLVSVASVSGWLWAHPPMTQQEEYRLDKGCCECILIEGCNASDDNGGYYTAVQCAKSLSGEQHSLVVNDAQCVVGNDDDGFLASFSQGEQAGRCRDECAVTVQSNGVLVR